MKPAKLDLPTIWRGCDWGPVTLKWKDQNGDPIDLSDIWQPRAQSLNINFHASIVDAPNGVTELKLSRTLTVTYRLGSENWDWIWERLEHQGGAVIYRFPPFLSGKVCIKEPRTSVPGDTPPIEIPELIEVVMA